MKNYLYLLSITNFIFIFLLIKKTYFINQLKNTISILQEIASDLAGSSEQVANLGINLEQASIDQISSISTTVTASHEINAMVGKTNDFSKELFSESTKLNDISKIGSNTVKLMVETSENLKNQTTHFQVELKSSLNNLSEVVRNVEEISQKTKLINDIVFQTKLLSFNASVEAARAGEHGKGFAVVAEEVGKLAQMSGNTATEINGIVNLTISKVQETMSETISKVELLTNQVASVSEEGLSQSKKCEDVFENLQKQILSINERIESISNATNEQSLGISLLDNSVVSLQEAAERNRLMASQSNENSQSFEGQISKLTSTTKEISEKLFNNKNIKIKLNQFVWSDKLIIGIESMDDEHKILVEKINELVISLEKNRVSNNLKDVTAVFNSLAAFVVKHFKDEEEVMRNMNYPQLASHQKIHSQLLEQVGGFEKQLLNNTLDDDKLISFLRNWLISHIMGIDIKYAQYLNQSK